MADDALWRKVRREYQRGLSGRACAERFGVPYGTLRDRAKREGWTVSRDRVQRTASAKTEQRLAEAIADEAERTTRRQLDVLALGLGKAGDLLADIRDPIKFGAWSGAVKALVQTQRLALGLAAPDGKGAVGAGAPEETGPPNRLVIVDPGDARASGPAESDRRDADG